MSRIDRQLGWSNGAQANVGVGVRREFIDALAPKIQVTPELNPVARPEKARWVRGEAVVRQEDGWLSPPSAGSGLSPHALPRAFSRILAKGQGALPEGANATNLSEDLQKEYRLLTLLSDRLDRRRQVLNAVQEKARAAQKKPGR